MAFPKRNNAFKAPAAPAAPDVDKVPDASADKAAEKPVSYSRGKYKKSGKVAMRKAFAGLMNKNKLPKI